MQNIINFVNSIPNPKSLIMSLKSRSELLKEVSDYQEKIGTSSLIETLYCIYYSVSPVKCGCGKNALFNTFNKGYRQSCSLTCPKKGELHSEKLKNVWKNTDAYSKMQSKKEATLIKKYGVSNAAVLESVKEKTKQTNLSRYGNQFSTQSDEIKSKIVQTNIEKYGVEFPFQSAEIRKKASESFEKNYGHSNDMSIPRNAFIEQYGKNPFEIDEIKEKITNTLQEKYGVDHPMKNSGILNKSIATLFSNYGKTNPAQLHYSDEWYEIINDITKFTELLSKMSVTEISEKYLVRREVIYAYHNKYNLNLLTTRTRSGYEEEIAKILDDLDIKYIRNYNKICFPNQLDFYIPKFQLAIEFNGLYWHSEHSGKKSHDYHAKKTQQCRYNNVTLLTIFEDEWLLRQHTIVSKIKHLCGKTNSVIGARKITITNEKYTNDVKQFLDKYHIQGKTEAVSELLVGRYFDKIVAVFLLRKISTSNYDIVRFCTDSNHSYPGLFSKFVKKAINSFAISKLTTIADLRWSTGDVYLKSGFVIDNEIKPDYQYTDYIMREHKFNYRKDKIAKKFNIDTTNKTENELMRELKFDRIWDCGKIKFVLNIQK